MRKMTILLASAMPMLLGPARAFALAATLDSIDDLPDEIKAEYAQGADGKFVLQVTGMRSEADFQRLQTAHNKEKSEHSALKTRISTVFGDRKFEEIQADLDRIPELETAAEGKLDDDKINALVEGRIKSRLTPVERERDNLKNDLAEREKTIGEYQSKETRRTIRDKAREAATEAKLLPEAVDDFLLLADNVFEVTDDGKVVVKDQVGHTPGLDPKALLTDLMPKRPHWWPASSGGGAGGNRGGAGGGAVNPFTHDNWNMTEQGKLMASDPAKAEQMAKQAGHKDAATAVKPAPKA